MSNNNVTTNNTNGNGANTNNNNNRSSQGSGSNNNYNNNRNRSNNYKGFRGNNNGSNNNRRSNNKNNNKNDHQNNNKNKNNKNSKNEFKGATEELEGYYFDCTTRRATEDCNKTLRQIATYIGKEWKHGDLVKYMVEELKKPELEEPEDHAADATKAQIYKW